MLKRFIGTVMAGVLYFLPMAVTVWSIGLVYNWSSTALGSQSRFYQILSGDDTPTVHPYLVYLGILALSLLIFWLIGRLGGSIASRRLRELVNRTMRRVPVLNTVYSSADQVAELFRGRELDDPAFSRSTVLVRIDNCYMLGLMVNAEAFDIRGVPHKIVYVPSAPLPTSGTNYLAPVADIHDVNLSVDELTAITMSLGGSGAAIIRNRQPLIIAEEPPSRQA